MAIELEDAVIGSWATYVPYHANGNTGHPDCQRGIITSKNDRYIFVRFKGPQGEACLPDQLVRG